MSELNAWPDGLVRFLVSDETARLDRVYDQIRSEAPQFATVLQRIAASSEFGMNRPMKDPAMAGRMLGPERVRHCALWYLMFDLMVEIGPEAVGEGICTASAALAIQRSSAAAPNPVAEYQAASAGFAARLGHWMLLREEKDTVISSLLGQLPAPKREPLQQHVLGRTATEARREQITVWNLGPTLKAACDPISSSGLGRLQLRAVDLVANPQSDAVTQDARRFASAMGGFLNLGGDPWLPASPPTPRDLLNKIGALRSSVTKAESETDEHERRISTLENQIAAGDLETTTGVMGAREMGARVEAEIKRARRHKRQLTLCAVRACGDTPEGYMDQLGGVLFDVSRSEDVVGLQDAEHLVILLPETDLNSARIFGERSMRVLGDTIGLLPAAMYMTSLEKEGSAKQEEIVAKVLAEVQKLAAANTSHSLDWNRTGSMGWR